MQTQEDPILNSLKLDHKTQRFQPDEAYYESSSEAEFVPNIVHYHEASAPYQHDRGDVEIFKH